MLTLVLGAMAMIGPFSIDMYLPAMPAMERDLQATTAEGQLTMSTYFLGMSLGQLLYGRASDKVGRRPVFFAGIALYIVASLICASTPNLPAIAAARLLQALGACSAIVIARAVIFDLYDAREGAQFLSRMVLVQGLAPIIAPIAGGWMAVTIGWRSIFYALAAAGAIIALITYLRLPETRTERALATSQGESMFAAYRAVLSNWPLMQASLAGSLASASFFTYLASASQLLIGTFGVAPEHFGYYFAANAVGFVIFAQINRALLTNMTPQDIMVRAIGGVLAAGIALLICTRIPGLGLWGLNVPMFLLVSAYAFIVPNALAIAQSYDRARTGAVAAVTGSISFSCGAAAAALSGLFFDGTATPMAIIIVIAAGVALLLRLTARDDPPAPLGHADRGGP
jgi:DHA1 family bicyclomycin/chloramphenicol resistance-like MFS transporter